MSFIPEVSEDSCSGPVDFLDFNGNLSAMGVGYLAHLVQCCDFRARRHCDP